MTKKTAFLWGRTVFGISLLIFLVWLVDIDKFISLIFSVKWQWCVLALVAILCSTVLGAYLLFNLFYAEDDIQYSKFLRIYWVGWAVGLVFPGQVGDVLALSAWLKKKGVSWSRVICFLLLDKAITLFWMLSIACMGAFFILNFSVNNFELSSFPLAYSLLVLAMLTCLGAIVFLRKSPKLTATVITVVKSRKLSIFTNYLGTPLKIILLISAYWVVFQGLNVEISYSQVLSVVAISSLAAYVPISFNGIGVVEWVAGGLFLTLSVEQETTLAAYVLLRGLVLFAAWFPILLYVLWGKVQK